MKQKHPNKRLAAMSTRMGMKFIARTSTGLIVDRDQMKTPQERQNKHFSNKHAPDGLAKFFKPLADLYP